MEYSRPYVSARRIIQGKMKKYRRKETDIDLNLALGIADIYTAQTSIIIADATNGRKLIHNIQFPELAFPTNWLQFCLSMSLLSTVKDAKDENIFVEQASLKGFLTGLPVSDNGAIKQFIMERGEGLPDLSGEESEFVRSLFDELELCVNAVRLKRLFGKSRAKGTAKGIILDIGKASTASDIKKLCMTLCFPGEKNAYSYSLFYIEKYDIIMAASYQEGGYLCFWLDDNDLTGRKEPCPTDISLLYNFIFYAQAFPESLVKGLPRDFTADPNFHSKGSKTLKINRSVLQPMTGEDSGKAGHSKTPHFRKGHFRYLGSDYYKGKKGQTVFVHSSLIGGKNASTLLKAKP